jgi:hypothetical protein
MKSKNKIPTISARQLRIHSRDCFNNPHIKQSTNLQSEELLGKRNKPSYKNRHTNLETLFNRNKGMTGQVLVCKTEQKREKETCNYFCMLTLTIINKTSNIRRL